MTVLNVHEWGPGDGPACLVIHGVQNTGARYRRLAQEGLPECRMLAVDLRGHADSLWDPPWNTETHVADLIETMDALGLQRVPVIGHSFGGMLGHCLPRFTLASGAQASAGAASPRALEAIHWIAGPMATSSTLLCPASG